ncbi:unnamed protein product, partial [Amoebophrya sp. A25]
PGAASASSAATAPQDGASSASSRSADFSHRFRASFSGARQVFDPIEDASDDEDDHAATDCDNDQKGGVGDEANHDDSAKRDADSQKPGDQISEGDGFNDKGVDS